MGDWLGDAARRASARGRVIPYGGPRVLTGAEMFGMTPRQIRAAQGLPPEPPPDPDWGGGNRGESASLPPEPGMNEILREAGALRKERKWSRMGY